MTTPIAFADRLAGLRAAAGTPSYERVAAWTKTLAQPGGTPSPGRSTVHEWLTGAVLPPQWEPLELVLTALIEKARGRGTPEDPKGSYQLRVWKQWYDKTRAAAAVPAGPVYQGLAAYGEADAARFFGRADDIEQLRERLDETHRRGGLLVVLGPSGVGKSSVLAAGLIPALATRGLPSTPDASSWPATVITPGSEPLQALAAAVPPLAAVLSDDRIDPATVRAAVAEHTHATRNQSRRQASSAAPESQAAASGNGSGPPADTAKSVLIVDQFEEVFQADPPVRARFIDVLVAAANANAPAPALVVLSSRDDFYPQLRGIAQLTRAMDRPAHVDPMTIEQLTEAITGPAKIARKTLEPALLTHILHDAGVTHVTGEPTGATIGGQLPLISHALRVISDRGALTSKAYNRAGGVAGAVRETADQAWRQLRAESLDGVALDMLIRLVRVDADRHDTRRRLPKAALLAAVSHAGNAGRALTLLSDARLVTATGTSVEITHDALLREWQQLRDAIDSERADLSLRQDIERRARQWDDAHRPPDRLYRGTELLAARRVAAKHRVDAKAQEFLAEGWTHRRRSVIARVIGVALIIGAGAFGLVEAYAKNNEADRAVFTEVVAQADRLRDSDASLAAQLYLTAYRMQPTPSLYTDLLDTENEPLSTPLPGHAGIVRSVAVSEDGKTLVSAGDDGTVQLWSRSARPTLLARITEPVHVTGVALTRDAKTLVSVDGAGMLRRWNIADPTHPLALGVPVPADAGPIWGIALSPDGKTLASVGSGQVRLWNIADPTHPLALGSPLPGAALMLYGTGIAFSPDGKTLAAAGVGGAVRLWNVTDPGHPVALGDPLSSGARVAYAVAFSHDGKTLVTAGGDTVLRLWNVAEPAHPALLDQPVTTPGSSILAVAISPDDDTVATANADDTVTFWDIAAPSRPSVLGRPLTGHTRGVGAIAFTPDGTTLITGSADSTVRLWSLPRTRLASFAGNVTSATFSHAGRTMAVSSTDGVRLWDTSNPEVPVSDGPVLHQDGVVNGVAFNADATVLASGGDGETVRLWNVTDPRHVSQLSADVTFSSEVEGLTFSNDGRILAVSCGDGAVRLFRMVDPRHPTPLGPPLVNTAGKLVGTVKFSPDGKVLASAGADQAIWLWDVADPTRAHAFGPPLRKHTDQVYQLSFSPDGKILASVGADHTVRLWNVTDPAHAAELGRPLDQHTNAVGGVSYSSDGATLASGSDDKTVRLWNVTDPAAAAPIGQPITGHTGFIYLVRFAPDGTTLASGGRDHTLLLWQLGVDHAIRRICATTPGELTHEAWNTYVSRERPYQPPCS